MPDVTLLVCHLCAGGVAAASRWGAEQDWGEQPLGQHGGRSGERTPLVGLISAKGN